MVFDIEKNENGEWSIQMRVGEAGRTTILTSSGLAKDREDGTEARAIATAMRYAYNKGRKDEAAVRVAALNGLLNEAPLTSR